MYHLPCALLLGAPLLLATDVDAPESTADADDVLRVYDVSTLSMDTWFEEADEGRSLLPAVGPFDSRDWESAEPEVMMVDGFVDLLLQLYEDEFEYEGRHIALSDSGRLIVRGPESLHERVARTLTFLEAVVNAEAVLAVDTVVLEGRVPDGAVIDQAAAEAWLASLDASVDHGHHVVRLRTDRPSHLDLGGFEYGVVDYDVEIAQSSAIQGPVIAPVHTGTQLEVLGAPGVGGTFLSFVLSRADRIPMPGMEVEMRFWAGSEQNGLDIHRDSSRRDDLRVMTRSHALATFLPAGKALVLASDIDLTGGEKREVVIVRQIGGGLPMRHELPLSDGGARLILADLGALAPPGVRSSGSLFSRASTALDWHFHHEHTLRSGLTRGEQDRFMAMDLIDTGQDYASLDKLGRFLVSIPYSIEPSEDEPGLRSEQEEVVGTFDSLLASDALYDVELTVRNAGAEPLQALMPLRAGAGAATVLGVQSVEVHDYDVEVASHAAVADSQMRLLLDGLCLWLEVTPTASGALVLEVHGGAQLAAPQTRFELGGQVAHFVHQTSVEKLILNERALMEQADGAWTAAFGDTSTGGLSLTVRVTRAH